MTGGESKLGRKSGQTAVWGILLIFVFLLAACGDRNTYVPPPPPKVTVSQPVRRDVTDYLEFTGNTQAINTVQLRARVEGYLEKVFFQDGDLVKKGQLLFLIQQNTYEAKLKQAEAELLANKARLEHAQTEYARFTRLVKQKAAAQTDVDRWHYERDAAQAAVLASEAQRDLAQLNLSYTRVTAPFNGHIGRRLKDPGTLVGAGEKTLLAEINQIDPIYVYFNINEQDLLRVIGKEISGEQVPDKMKHRVSFGLADEKGYPHQGYLDFAAISLSPTTGTLLLRGVFANPTYKILPGLFARVRAPLAGPRPALLVPQVAIGFDQLGPYVLVVNDQKVVERRAVKLGATEDDYRVAAEGLQGGEWVIVNGLLRAIPGKQVSPQKETTSASTGSKTPQAPPNKSGKAAP